MVKVQEQNAPLIGKLLSCKNFLHYLPIYPTVPTLPLTISPSGISTAKPKSDILTWPWSSSSKFSGLQSLYTIPRVWRSLSPQSTYKKYKLYNSCHFQSKVTGIFFFVLSLDPLRSKDNINFLLRCWKHRNLCWFLKNWATNPHNMFYKKLTGMKPVILVRFNLPCLEATSVTF